jgi:hypothetical protein
MMQARGHGFSELGRAFVVGRAEAVRVYTPATLADGATLPNDRGQHAERSGGDRVNEGARIRL